MTSCSLYNWSTYTFFFTLLPAHHFHECFHVETGKQKIHKKKREKTMMSRCSCIVTGGNYAWAGEFHVNSKQWVIWVMQSNGKKTQGCIHAQVESSLPIGVQTFTQLKKHTARLLQNCWWKIVVKPHRYSQMGNFFTKRGWYVKIHWLVGNSTSDTICCCQW